MCTLYISSSSEDRRYPAQTTHIIPKLRTSSAQTHEVRPHCPSEILTVWHFKLSESVCVAPVQFHVFQCVCVFVAQTTQRRGDRRKPLLLLRLWKTQRRDLCLSPWQVQTLIHPVSRQQLSWWVDRSFCNHQVTGLTLIYLRSCRAACLKGIKCD